MAHNYCSDLLSLLLWICIVATAGNFSNERKTLFKTPLRTTCSALNSRKTLVNTPEHLKAQEQKMFL